MVNLSNPLTSPGQAANAYSNTAKQITGAGDSDASGIGGGTGGASFGSMLEGAVKSSMDTIKAGEAASVGAITGKANLLDVTSAISAAKMTLETTVAVRDNVVDAYNKIMSMPI